MLYLLLILGLGIALGKKYYTAIIKYLDSWGKAIQHNNTETLIQTLK